MRKGWKVFWITCTAVAGVGLACCIAGTAMGATVSAMNEQFPHGFHIIRRWNARSYADGETTSDTDMSETFSGIREVNMEVSAMSVQILPADSNDIKLETANVDQRLKFNYYVDEDELVIETKKNLAGITNAEGGTLWLYLPESQIADIDLEIGVGELYVENLNADSFSLKVGAGEASVDNFNTRELDFDCGVGSISAAGTVKEEAKIDCGIGSVDFTTSGTEADYNYEISCGIGEVSLGGASYSGLGSKKHIDNSSAKDIHVECGIGEVTVNFEQDM